MSRKKKDPISVMNELFREVYTKAIDEWLSRNNRTTDKKADCDHKWKLYDGFVEIYEYCEVCDKKRGEL